jgi:hypothetical protein
MSGDPYVPGTAWVPTSGISIANDASGASTADLSATDEAALDRTEQFTMPKLIVLGTLPFVSSAGHFAVETTYMSLVTSTTPGDQAILTIPGCYLVHGATISTVELLFVAATGHAGLPFSPPKLTFARYAIAVGAALASPTVIGDDPYGVSTLADYNNGNVKRIQFSAASHVVDAQAYTYQIVIDDESGANALVGARYIAFRVNYE